MQSVLLFGARGYLGSFISKYSKEYPYKMVLSARSRDHLVNGADIYPCDLLDKSSLSICLDRVNPDVIINAAAQALPDDAEKDQKYASDANINTVQNLVKECTKRNIKLIHISTDYVFNGQKGNYKEDDETDPINFYGKTKLKGEEIILKSKIDYLILRTSVLYGLRYSHQRMNLFHSIYEPLMKKQLVELPKDQIGTPTLVDDMARCVLELVPSTQKGIYHCAGPDQISRYEFGLMLAHVFDFKEDLVKPIINKIQTAIRPKNSSLNSEKLKTITSFRFKGVREGLNFLKEVIKKNDEKIVLDY
jgi:dTDP-4-dehydrorhamnose reductase